MQERPVLDIIEATEAHTALIRHIAEETWPTAYGEIISEEQITYMLEMMYSHDSLAAQMKKGHQFYLAYYNNEGIGFASVSKEAHDGCKLNKLYILPRIQGTGAGKALLQKAIQYTKDQQCSTLFLQVNKQNKAKDFYERMGFTVREEIKLDIGNGFFMDDYIMELAV